MDKLIVTTNYHSDVYDNKYYHENYKITKDTNVEEIIISDNISGAGGGGGACFPKGTFVKTLHGHKPIEMCMIGDIIIAYDRFGELNIAHIDEVTTHKRGTYQDDLYFIQSDGVELFPFGITGNHAVYDVKTGEHKEIQEFTLGDILVNMEGIEIIITSITIIPNAELEDDFAVYNLIVSPQHTYLAGTENSFIRVHNGGGGKATGGTSSGAMEDPNTLRSSAVARVLDLISHGEIVGIFGGGDPTRGIYFNSTPLKNANGAYNFTHVTVATRNGLPSQTVISGFTDVETEVIMSPLPILSGTPVIQYLPDSGKQSAKVTIGLPDGLWWQNTNTGDIHGNSVSYNIYVKDNAASTWNLVISRNINGKTTTPWECTERVYAPSGSTSWGIKIERTSYDPLISSAKSTLQWARLTEILEQTYTYPNMALVGLTVAAQDVGNAIPDRGYNVTGIKLQIPSNYNPITRTYGSTYWDGTFQTAWSDNPAWVLYDLITNVDYGLSHFLGQAINVDKWAFYEAALYNDCATWHSSYYTYNYIPDGVGGFEVRYTFNAVITTQTDAWQLLHAVASNMRALIVMNGDTISLIQDKPKPAKKIIINSNILDGMFIYSGSEISSRATAINVTFNDKYDRYLPRTITESDATAVAKWGYTTKDLAAYGCVTESQARRMAKWALYTELNNHDMVSFSLALNVINLAVGDCISIMDDNYISSNNEYLTGRISSITGNTVILGNNITLKSGHNYTFGIMSLDYTYIIETHITDSIIGTWVTDTIHLNFSPEVGDYANHEFFCFSSGYVEPRQFIIQSIAESQKGIYAITAIFYDPNKFDYIEKGISVVPPVYSTIISTVIPPVGTISFREVFMNDGIAAHNYIEVTWLWDETHTISDPIQYSLRWRRDNNNWTSIPNIPLKNYHIPDTTPGVYDVSIIAVNLQGKQSLASTNTYNYRTSAGSSSIHPPINLYVLGTIGTSFIDNHIPISWDYPASNDTVTDRLLDYILEIWTPDGLTKLSSHVVVPNISNKGGKFDYTYAQNINDFVTPSRSVEIKVYSRDLVGYLSSTAISAVFSNPVPATVGFTIMSGAVSAFVHITPSSELDVTGYKIWRSLTSSFTKDGTTEVYDGTDVYVTLNVPTNDTYYYAVAAYDSFGKTGLNISSEISSTPLAIDAIKWNLSGILFTIDNVTPNKLNWTGGTIIRNGGTSYTISAGTITWTTGLIYIYFNPATSTTGLQTTLSLGTAVGAGTFPIATYEGGAATNIKGGDGSAFFSGSQLIAGTVGASQLIVGSAVITGTAQIANGIIEEANMGSAAINNAAIKDYIQSANWSPGTGGVYTGWKMDKAGNITSYGNLDIRDTSNNSILTTGTSAGIEWGKVNNKTGFASISQINSSNISTYIANAAIQSAQIGSAQIQNANIGTAAIDTLQVAGNAITVPTSFSAGAVTLSQNAQTIVINSAVTFYGGTANILISWAAPARWDYTTYMYLTQLPFTGYLYIDGGLVLVIPYTFDSGAAIYSATLSGSHTIRLDWAAVSNISGTGSMNSSHILIIEAKR